MLKGRAPHTWQTELIDHVMWWTRATRTRVTQKKARAAPAHPSTAYPIAVGTTMLITAMSARAARSGSIARSAMRSGAYFAVSVPV